MTKLCTRCAARQAVWDVTGGRPSWIGSPIQCAFPDGFFVEDNWNCATANAVRDLVEVDRTFWSNEQHLGVLRMDGQFLVVSWYKNRGRTEQILIVDQTT